MATLQATLQAACLLLSQSPTPKLDAEVLLAFILQKDRAYVWAHGDDELNDQLAKRFRGLVQQRAAGEPIAYLTGHQEFWSMDFKVTPAVLIPRPETELLIEKILALTPKDQAIDLIDLGTGSGAIACAIAHERSKWHIIATDVSTAALHIASENIHQLKLKNVELVQSHWFEKLADRKFDIIVSNPPYISEQDKHLSEGDVRFEPRGALASGEMGLDDIRAIVLDAPNYLKPGGMIFLEHGFGQGESARDILLNQGFINVQTFKDLAGLDRVTFGYID